MKGIIIGLVFFTLGFLVATAVPIGVESRLAFSSDNVSSVQRVDFDSIKVYPDEVIIRQPGIHYAKVASNSMAPIITDKSTVFEKEPQEGEIIPGDVISFYEPSVDGVVLHLVTEVVEKDGGQFYKTKGVANDSEDPWLVPFDSVKGVMVGTFK